MSKLDPYLVVVETAVMTLLMAAVGVLFLDDTWPEAFFRGAFFALALQVFSAGEKRFRQWRAKRARSK